MNLSITLIIVIATGIVSWLAFNNRQLLDRLILWPPAVDRHKQYDRLVTHGFIHADLGHLLFNMITLFFFGRPVEQVFVERIGVIGFVLFYLSRSEEHTSELQSLMRTSYAVFCLTKKNKNDLQSTL